MTQPADIGLIGLAVMGENLVMNMESKGFTVAVYNRSPEKTRHFIQTRARERNIVGTESLEELVASLKSPRKIMMMIKAGKAVDALIDQLIPHLDQGDVLIDGGNSNFEDTIERVKRVESAGLLYVGTGVSGGEEGALTGPSIMPGGSEAAWKPVRPIFQAISAKADDSAPCCEWMGAEGAGHFVKMVHNGIEYGDMQLIAEAYHLMKSGLGMTPEEMKSVFTQWNRGDLDSYLIDITADIVAFKDDDGGYLLDKILDVAGQKGTGRWTLQAAIQYGVPLTLIGESVFSRFLSSFKALRQKAAAAYNKQIKAIDNDKESFIDHLGQALYASKIISYSQGFSTMRAAARYHHWTLNFRDIALIWRGGCIIRSVFLDRIADAFANQPELETLILDPFFQGKLAAAEASWRKVVIAAIESGIPVPTFSAALSYFDGLRTAQSPANLLQAQRDYFGAHTYQRIDRHMEDVFHTNWTGKGGTTTSSTYEA